MSDAVRSYWDSQAGTFDAEADHGLLDPAVREAWAELLLPLMPGPGCDVADLGCGTGSLSLLLGEAGHHVWGVGCVRSNGGQGADQTGGGGRAR
ncbi:hypothetical protein ACFWIX_11350 [Pseudarthrobacter sp. NPDC058362]|uniref:hypothetical protein n=1 Tax=Pseudarthrobacter sp. NPDC058362 TaxID=3346458 RepID=UPI003650B380